VKSVLAPHLGRQVKFGRRRPIAVPPHFRFRNYLKATAPAAPPTCDYRGAAKQVLDLVLLNDQLGDCAIAGGYHIVGVETGNAGALFIPTQAQIIHDYSAIGGYKPGKPETDNGCILTDALNYWTTYGFANGTKLLGWLTVDAKNKAEVMAALYLFENLYFGIELPDAWISPFPSKPGFIWDVAGAPNEENGHCIIGDAYDQTGVKVDSWGLDGTLTWAAIAEYATRASNGELYVMLTPDQLAKGQNKAPNGVAWVDLLANFNAMGGHVPLPPPPVHPAPPPQPSHALTLAAAQAWATAPFNTAPFVITRWHAAQLAAQGLAAHWPKPQG
jgi:hypothetical protein